MRKEDQLVIDGIAITVKELTVGEVRHWMMDLAEKENISDTKSLADNALDQNLFDNIALSDIARMTSLSANQVEQFTPSELKAVVEKCKGLNPDFFALRRQLLASVPRNA